MDDSEKINKMGVLLLVEAVLGVQTR